MQRHDFKTAITERQKQLNLDKYETRIIVTGGAGFIGSNLLNHLVPKYSNYLFINVDCLTYAGNQLNVRAVSESDNYRFENIDIGAFDDLRYCFDRYQPNGLIHLAAESHVDRSIVGPAPFIATNIIGTFNLLELSRKRFDETGAFRFHHVSTDEVFGSLDAAESFTEESPYAPNSPYSASKAAADHLVRAYYRTYGLNVVTTNCSNNFGPHQYPEKLIPLIIRNALAGRSLPVYGDGRQVRDWLYVTDHVEALDLVYHRGAAGATYNIGGRNEIENVELVRRICRLLDELCGRGAHEELITFVEDRPGHDRRYAIDPSFIESTLGWKSRYGFEEALRSTVRWYIDNAEWIEQCNCEKVDR